MDRTIEISNAREVARDDVETHLPPDDQFHGEASYQAFDRLQVVWRKRKELILITMAGMILSAMLAFSLPKRYDATTQLMPPDDRSNSPLALLAAIPGQAAGALGSLAGDLLGAKTSGALFVGVLSSRTIQTRLVERFNLKQVYGKKLLVDACKMLAENTSISEDRKSGIISITLTDHDPKRAAALAQAYVEELDRLVAELSTSSARRERIFLEGRLNSVKQDLDDAASRLGTFSSKNATIDMQIQGKAMVDAAAQLQGELIAAQAQAESLREIYSDNNVRVREIQARISELQRQLDKLGGSATKPPGDQMTGDANAYPSIRQLPLLGITYADLYRRTKIEEVVYETLTQQFELAKVQEAKEIPSVKVLDAATAPERKSWPPRAIIILLGTTVVFFFGCAWILCAASWSNLEPTDPAKVFVLGVVGDARDDVARLTGRRTALRTIFGRPRKRGT